MSIKITQDLWEKIFNSKWHNQSSKIDLMSQNFRWWFRDYPKWTQKYSKNEKSWVSTQKDPQTRQELSLLKHMRQWSQFLLILVRIYSLECQQITIQICKQLNQIRIEFPNMFPDSVYFQRIPSLRVKQAQSHL